jgi:4-aminobutyrate aminotransferase
MLEQLHTWPEKHPIVGEVRGRGLMIGIEIVKDQQSREVAGLWRDRIVELAFERGLLILGCGETSIRLAPPLIVNEHETAIALEILEECVALVEEEHGG